MASLSTYKQKITPIAVISRNWKPHQTKQASQTHCLPIKLQVKMHWPEQFFGLQNKFDLNSEKHRKLGSKDI